MTSDLTLDSFTFAGFEVPERIGIGGEQDTVIHRLPGGVRIIDAMGWFPREALTWSGRFRGSGALSRAQTVEAIFKAGKPVTVSWSECAYLVIPKSFQPDFERDTEIPYSLSLEVLEDRSSPATDGSDIGVDDMMSSDFFDASDYGAEIGDDELTGGLSDLAAAISGVVSFATATRAQLGTVTGPLGVVQSRVSVLIDGLVIDDTSLGGVFPGGLAASMAAALQAAVSGVGKGVPLYGLQSTLGRMTTNLTDVAGAGTTVQVSGGDLYRMAAQAYGDASAWPTIARANALTDPVLFGKQSLLIPPTPVFADGLLAP